jgi:hypothetical protein
MPVKRGLIFVVTREMVEPTMRNYHWKLAKA